jgi:hypothetical protein
LIYRRRFAAAALLGCIQEKRRKEENVAYVSTKNAYNDRKLRRVEIQDPPRLDVKTPTETELRKASVEKENPMSRARPPGPQKTTSSAYSSRKNERNGKFGIHDQTDLVEFYRSIQ